MHSYTDKLRLYAGYLLFIATLSILCFKGRAQTTTPAAETETTSSWVNPEHTSEDYMDFTSGWFIGADVGRTVFYGDVALYNVFPKPSEFKESLGNCGSFYFGKKFTYGLSAEIQGFKGSLTGDKLSGRLYRRHFDANFFQYSVNVKYNLSQLAFRDIPGRKFFNRFTVYITAGGGQIFFRSRLYKLAANNLWYLEKTMGYDNTGIDSVSTSMGAGDVTGRTKMLSAIAIPAGAKINFRLNGATNIVFDATYSTILSDQVDGWVRDWSHQDRYLYLGLGLVYNLNTGDGSDIPEDQRLFRPKSKSKSGLQDAYDKDAGSGKPERRSLFNFGGGRSKEKNSKEDRDLEVRMKMYELQLKLFEMQYLLGH